MATKKSKRSKGKRKHGARPLFAERYPRDERLERLLDAFDAGNFAQVRTEAAKLDAEVEEEDVRAALRDLRRRIDPEPTAIYIWALGVALLVFLFGYYVQHAH